MKIYSEISLRDFEFWSGAKDRVKYLSMSDLDRIEFVLEEIYFETEIEDTTINDIFWFEEDWIAEILGYSNFEELMEDRSED